MAKLRMAIIALLITLLALGGFGLNHELNRIKQSIAELREENQKIRDDNRITKARIEWELEYQEATKQWELADIGAQLLELQTLQRRKNSEIAASIADLQTMLKNGLNSEGKQRKSDVQRLQSNITNLQSSLKEDITSEREQRESAIALLQSNIADFRSSLEENILSEKEQRKSDVKRLQADDEELRQRAAKDAQELRIALESLKTEIESSANNFQNLRNYLEDVEYNILTRLEKDYIRATELKELKKTVELFIEEIRILEDKEVKENLTAPKRTNEVYPVLLLASDDKEPTENEKQEMLRSLAVARAWYNDKTGETFRFNKITIVKSARAAEWFKTCPLSQSRTQDEDGMLWECIQYELGDRRIPGLPRLWSNSVYFVFMPSFNSYYRGYGAFSNGSGLAIVGRETIQELNENSINRLTAIKTVTHELGHALGLNHIDDPSMLMYPKESADFPKIGLTPEDVETLAENPFLE